MTACPPLESPSPTLPRKRGRGSFHLITCRGSESDILFDPFPCYGAGAMNLESSLGATSDAAAGSRSPRQRPAGACGIDFGTSNSAAAIVDRDQAHVLALQDGRQSIPTAVFFSFDDDSVAYGREAMRRHL